VYGDRSWGPRHDGTGAIDKTIKKILMVCWKTSSCETILLCVGRSN